MVSVSTIKIPLQEGNVKKRFQVLLKRQRSRSPSATSGTVIDRGVSALSVVVG
jgi:hypothetical protein